VSIGTDGFQTLNVLENQRVGVGAADPATKLEVRDSSGQIASVRIRNDGVGGQERIEFAEGDEGVAAAAAIVTFNSSAAGGDANLMRFANNRAGGSFDFVTGGSRKLALLNNGDLYASKDVGIGTLAPGGRLHVASATTGATSNALGDELLLESQHPGISFLSFDGANQASIFFGNASDNDRGRITYTYGNDRLNLFAANTQRLLLDATGVGVNLTTAPSQALDINGQVRIRGGSPAAGRVLVSDDGGVGTWADPGGLGGVDDGDWTISGVNLFSAVSGKVGIGVDTPQAKLHVRTAASGSFSISSAADELLVENNSHGGVTIRTPDTAIGTLAFADSGASLQGAVRYRHADDALTLSTNGNVERVRIDSAGRVGIGVDTPQTKLHVRTAASGSSSINTAADDLLVENNSHGGVTIRTPDTASGTLAFADSGASLQGAVRYRHADDSLTLNTNGNVEQVRIDAAGNVGVGDTSPTFKLDVNGTLRSTGAAAFNSTVNIGNDTTGQAGLNVAVTNNAQGVAVFNRTADDGTLLRFRRGSITQGTISVNAGVVSYNPFTGSHYGWTDEPMARGMLVSLTGENHTLEDVPGAEMIYGVTASRTANDPAVMGAYLALQSPATPASTANPHLIMAVGNGEVWVVDDGKNVEIGSYLVASGVPGHAMADRGQFETSHIVARAAEPVRWDEVDEYVTTPDGQRRKHARMSIFFESFVIDRSRPAGASSTKVDDSAERVYAAADVQARQTDTIERLETELESTRQAVDELRALVLQLMGERGGVPARLGQE
jgi:hypothetical protein